MTSASQQAQDDEVDIIDVWRVLHRQRRWILLSFVIAAGLALIYVLLARPVWEATAVIQIGQIGQVGGADREKSLVEPTPRTVERLKLNSFEDAVLTALKIPLDANNPEANLYRNSVKVKLLPNTDLIELKVRGYSPEDAARWVDATVAHLREVHEKIAAPSILRITLQLSEITNDLQKAKAERDRILQNIGLKEQISPGNRFAENVLFANILNNRDAEIRDLEQRKLTFEEQLSPARTYATSLMDKIHVPERPAFPKKGLTVILAGVVGMILGIIAAFVIDYVQKNKSIPA